jgi:hypothetical protein
VNLCKIICALDVTKDFTHLTLVHMDARNVSKMVFVMEEMMSGFYLDFGAVII